MYCCCASSAVVPLIALQASNLARRTKSKLRLLARGIALGRLFIESVQLQHSVVVLAFGKSAHVLLGFCKSSLQIRHRSPLELESTVIGRTEASMLALFALL